LIDNRTEFNTNNSQSGICALDAGQVFQLTLLCGRKLIGIETMGPGVNITGLAAAFFLNYGGQNAASLPIQ
jgi:hypothetical protein